MPKLSEKTAATFVDGDKIPFVDVSDTDAIKLGTSIVGTAVSVDPAGASNFAGDDVQTVVGELDDAISQKSDVNHTHAGALGGYATASDSGNTVLDLADGTTQRRLMTADLEYTLPTVASDSFTLILVQDGTGGRDATFAAPGGATLEWQTSDDAAPYQNTTASGYSLYTFVPDTVSTRWFGFGQSELDEKVGLDFPSSHIRVGNGTTVWPTANLCFWIRTSGRGTISKVGLQVTIQSGNISVAAYRNSGAGRAAVPGTRLATSGAVSCPAVGYAEVSLGASVTLEDGDWLALSCDNTTASFVRNAGGGGISDLGLGMMYGKASSHPAPTSNPASLVARSGPDYCLVGVA